MHPMGRFPYVVSSDNYNCIILPASFKGEYEKNWDGTGPFKLDKFTPKVGASFVRNDAYWGEKSPTGPDRVHVLRRAAASHPGASGRAGGPSRSAAGDRRPGVAQRSQRHDHPREEHGAPAGAYAMRYRAFRRSSGSARPWRSRSTARSSWRACCTASANSATTAPSRPPTRHRHPRSRNASRTWRRRSNSSMRRGVGKGFKVNLTTETYLEIPQYAVLAAELRPRGRDRDRTQDRIAGRLLREGHLRPIGLARQRDGHHGLRPSWRAQRVSSGRRCCERRTVELRPLQEQEL